MSYQTAKLKAAYIVAAGCMICSQSSMTRAIGQKPNQSILEAAKQKAANALPESALGESDFEYRNVRVADDDVKIADVCGEVKARNNDVWSKFRFDVQADQIDVEPYPQINEATSKYFAAQCKAAVRKWKPGDVGSADDIRACEASSLFAHIRFERAKFFLVHEGLCPAQ